METQAWKPVAVAKCDDYTPELCRHAIAEIAAKMPVLQNIKPGMRIIIKANLITLMRPEKAATTHPALLAALVAYLTQKGAFVSIGDSPGGPFNKAYLESVYRTTCMTEAEKAGAELNMDFSVKSADFSAAVAAKSFEYTGYLDNADMIINFCKLKTHGMMTMSCAVKNMFGVVPGLTKPAYHYQYPDYPSFANMLIDLNEFFRPAINIVDAVIGMEGNGPTAGTPRRIGAVLASESPYTLDLVCAGLIGLTISDVPTLKAAFDRGLAPQTAEECPQLDQTQAYCIPDFKAAASRLEMAQFISSGGPLAGIINTEAQKILAIRPMLSRSKCVGCKKCARLCPAHAIEMKRGKPHIRTDACIRCFCCQEFCPEGALIARRSKAGNLILKYRK